MDLPKHLSRSSSPTKGKRLRIGKVFDNSPKNDGLIHFTIFFQGVIWASSIEEGLRGLVGSNSSFVAVPSEAVLMMLRILWARLVLIFELSETAWFHPWQQRGACRLACRIARYPKPRHQLGLVRKEPEQWFTEPCTEECWITMKSYPQNDRSFSPL